MDQTLREHVINSTQPCYLYFVYDQREVTAYGYDPTLLFLLLLIAAKQNRIVSITNRADETSLLRSHGNRYGSCIIAVNDCSEVHYDVQSDKYIARGGADKLNYILSNVDLLAAIYIVEELIHYDFFGYGLCNTTQEFILSAKSLKYPILYLLPRIKLGIANVKIEGCDLGHRRIIRANTGVLRISVEMVPEQSLFTLIAQTTSKYKQQFYHLDTLFTAYINVDCINPDRDYKLEYCLNGFTAARKRFSKINYGLLYVTRRIFHTFWKLYHRSASYYSSERQREIKICTS